MKQTVLLQKHLQLKAKMTDFQGWQTPQYFADPADECHAVRTAAGLFDTGFLGRIEIAGPEALSLLQNVYTRNIRKMAERSAHYGFLCNEAGFILDDSLLFRLSDAEDGQQFLLTTNALNKDKILLWLGKHAPAGVRITDKSQSLAQLALQGPQSASILERVLGSNYKKFKPRIVKELHWGDTAVLISRTGYTGEHGYEFFLPAADAEPLWDAIMNEGKELGLMPCGMASRDILRLEMGYLLYGNDIDESRTPLDAGKSSFVDFKKDFIGKESLEKQKASGTTQKLAGFEFLDKGTPRTGGSIFSESHEIGAVTSGCFSPFVRKGIGLGYVISRYAQPGQEIEIEVRDREIAAKIVDLPFHRKK
jgi:aminomethyltransferase